MIENRKTTSYVSPLYLLCKSALPPYQSRCKVGERAKDQRVYYGGKAKDQRYVNYMKNCNY